MNKQTQTKMFDFSDVDLDFCAGSKNKFPTVFKKMLAQGYNSKVVSSVTVSSDQVTLDYGVNHGYVADRALAINTTGLSGEFYIDSVTSNTVTLTVPNAPTSITGGFTTKVASLGWELVYEQAHIHIYKFKHIDETDQYARLCFQNTTGTGRNCIAVGVGKTANLSTGAITDANCLPDLASCQTVDEATSNFKWDFVSPTTRTYDNYTYSQGLATFGRGVVVGSKYHIALLFSAASSAIYTGICGIFPTASIGYESLDYPLVWGSIVAPTANISAMTVVAAAYIASTPVIFLPTTTTTSQLDSFSVRAASSFLPVAIDNFNTTTGELIPLYIKANGQFVGYAHGVFRLEYGGSNTPPMLPTESPSTTVDIDLNSTIQVHKLSGSSSANHATFYAFPVEPVKYA